MSMSVLDQLVHMTVRIECDGGRSSGTGFIFNFCQRGEQHVPAIVSNKHVIAGAQHGSFYVTFADGAAPKYGDRVRVSLERFEAGWVKHPNPEVDLAAFPIASIVQKGHTVGKPLFYRAANKELIADAAFMTNELHAIEDVS